MLAQQAYGFLVFAGGATFPDIFQYCLVITFYTKQEAYDTCFFVQMQDIGIPYDVTRAGRAYQGQWYVLGNQGFQKSLPGFAGSSR